MVFFFNSENFFQEKKVSVQKIKPRCYVLSFKSCMEISITVKVQMFGTNPVQALAKPEPLKIKNKSMSKALHYREY